MSEWNEYLSLKLNDPETKKAYDELENEYNLISAIIQFRIDNNLTQEQFAECVGIKQPNLARIESGATKPSFATLEKFARAMGKKLSFV